MDYMNTVFLNKEVMIYPGDTDSKYGIVKEINAAGIIFEITERTSKRSDLRAGQIVFIAMQKLSIALA